MKALILSSNTGAGHNSCAGAVQEALMARGVPCDIRDGLSFLSKEASRFISDWHVRLYRTMPKLYGEGYGMAEKRAHSVDDDSLIFRFLSLGAKPLRACIASQGYTAVVCTHLFPAMMLTQMQRQNPLPIVTAFISTDYTASPGYEAIDLDWCFVPSPQIIDEFVTANMPAERIVGTGMPVARAFLERHDPAEARRSLGVDPDHRHLLVMSGSMGCGPIKRIMKRLSPLIDESIEVSVICGSNRKLSRQLSEVYSDRQNIHILDFVDYVALFMDSANLYLTKPGGLSVSEALVKRLPMVLINAVEGCESHNMRFCLDNGAAVTADDPEEIAGLCVRLIRDEDALAAMRGARGAVPERPAAETVCDYLQRGETDRHGL